MNLLHAKMKPYILMVNDNRYYWPKNWDLKCMTVKCYYLSASFVLEGTYFLAFSLQKKLSKSTVI